MVARGGKGAGELGEGGRRNEWRRTNRQFGNSRREVAAAEGARSGAL